jgi:threonine/homoserine/homoserine lactone efflux protein
MEFSMSYISLFMWSFGVTIGAVMSPGPVSTAIVTEGARRGFRVGPLVSTGHALTELVMVGALALGMGQVLEHPVLAAAIGVLGGLFLLWMGGTMAWEAAQRRSKLPRADEGSEAAGRNLIGLGVATTASNPFWYMWWIGVGGGYVLMAQQQGLIALVLFYLGHILADYVWNTLLASVVGSGRRWFTDGIYQALLLVCGLFLVYTGVRFIWVGIGMVTG